MDEDDKDKLEGIGKAAMNVTASQLRLTTSLKTSRAAMELALYHSRLILGCYKTDDVSDPKVYVTAVAAVLARYAPDIGARLSDPKDGVAGKVKWLPSISEIRALCEEMQDADRAAAKRRADLQEQWRLRDQFEEFFPTGPRPDPYNVFVPTFAPQYAEMVNRGGRPGFSLEDKTRAGVWVPHKWFDEIKAKPAWKPYTPEQLQAIYGREQPKPEEPPREWKS